MLNKNRKRVICVTGYSAVCPSGAFRAVVLSDLHNRRCDDILERVRELSPDVVLLPGDICEKLRVSDFSPERLDRSDTARSDNRVGLGFLRELASVAPTFCSFGNHELVGADPHSDRNAELFSRLARDISDACGVRALDNSYATFVLPSGERIYIGGLTSGFARESFAPDLPFVDEFSALPGYKVLLSHHPEYFPRYIAPKNIDISLSGHAHGGQIRLFGRGLFAPGQGLLPKYTSGAHTALRRLARGEQIIEPAMIVSRGLANNAPFFIPRLGNPIEIVVVDFTRE